MDIQNLILDIDDQDMLVLIIGKERVKPGWKMPKKAQPRQAFVKEVIELLGHQVDKEVTTQLKVEIIQKISRLHTSYISRGEV